MEIQILFKDLRLVIDVEFLIMSDDIPTLLSMRDLAVNNLDISLQKSTISLAERSLKLKFENYFLINEWSPKDVSLAMYAESDLFVIHRIFGQPVYPGNLEPILTS